MLRSLSVYALTEVFPKDLTVTASTELGPTLVSFESFSAIWVKECVCPWNEKQSYFQSHMSWIFCVSSEFCLLPPCSLYSSLSLSMNVSYTARSQLAPLALCPENSLAKSPYSESNVPYCQLYRWQCSLLFLLLPGLDHFQWQFVTPSLALSKWWQSHLYPTPNTKPVSSISGFCFVILHF